MLSHFKKKKKKQKRNINQDKHSKKYRQMISNKEQINIKGAPTKTVAYYDLKQWRRERGCGWPQKFGKPSPAPKLLRISHSQEI